MKMLLRFAIVLFVYLTACNLRAETVRISLLPKDIENQQKFFASSDKNQRSDYIGNRITELLNDWEKKNPDKILITWVPNDRFQLDTGYSEIVAIWITYRLKETIRPVAVPVVPYNPVTPLAPPFR